MMMDMYKRLRKNKQKLLLLGFILDRLFRVTLLGALSPVDSTVEGKEHVEEQNCM